MDNVKATSSSMNNVQRLSIDSTGIVYIADYGMHGVISVMPCLLS